MLSFCNDNTFLEGVPSALRVDLSYTEAVPVFWLTLLLTSSGFSLRMVTTVYGVTLKEPQHVM
jgi:hypothetical protein